MNPPTSAVDSTLNPKGQWGFGVCCSCPPWQCFLVAVVLVSGIELTSSRLPGRHCALSYIPVPGPHFSQMHTVHSRTLYSEWSITSLKFPGCPQSRMLHRNHCGLNHAASLTKRSLSKPKTDFANIRIESKPALVQGCILNSECLSKVGIVASCNPKTWEAETEGSGVGGRREGGGGWPCPHAV